MAEKWMPMFAVDGGITTGLVYGCFPPKGTMKGRVARAWSHGCLTFEHVINRGLRRTPEDDVVEQLMEKLEDWNVKLDKVGLAPSTVLIEDFILRAKHPGMDRSVLSSVRVCQGMESVLIDRSDEGMEFLTQPVTYLPSEAKGYANNERLKRWGLWVPGKDHARDAARLIALHLTKKKGSKFS